MFPSKRLHGIWVGEQLSGVFSGGVSDLIFLCFGLFLWSQICSLRLVFLRHVPFHGGRRLLLVQQPPAIAVPILHARRVAYMR
jgi:hypothetical protein